MSAVELQQENSVRTYTVGVPLVVNIHDDGRVTYEVDLSEVTDDLGEHSTYPDMVIDADEAKVAADLYRRDHVHMVDSL